MGGEAAPGERQETIFSALKNKEGIGDLVLRRLGAAGLTTVNQLRMAQPEEIAQVSGLDLKIVRNILRLLSDDVPEEVPEDVPEEVRSLHEEVLQKLRAEVEAEASVEDLKAEVRRLRSLVSEHRAELRTLDNSRKEKNDASRLLSARTAEQTAILDDLHTKRGDLARRCASSDEAVQRQEVGLDAIRRERRKLEVRTAGLNRAIGGLADRLGRLRRSVAKGRSVE